MTGIMSEDARTFSAVEDFVLRTAFFRTFLTPSRMLPRGHCLEDVASRTWPRGPGGTAGSGRIPNLLY